MKEVSLPLPTPLRVVSLRGRSGPEMPYGAALFVLSSCAPCPLTPRAPRTWGRGARNL